jgi:hypothetical protein
VARILLVVLLFLPSLPHFQLTRHTKSPWARLLATVADLVLRLERLMNVLVHLYFYNKILETEYLKRSKN